jgi:hypothetical protein
MATRFPRFPVLETAKTGQSQHLRIAGDEPGKRGYRKQKQLAIRISCSPFPGGSWHLAVGIDDADPVAVAS